MSNSVRILASGLMMVAVAGCHAATRIVDYPRVDLDVNSGGNRGYLVGAPPASSGPWKSERQTVETEVEVPAFSKRAGQAPAGMNEGVLPEGDMAEESAWNQASASHEIIGNYTVQSGDTLWSIAASRGVYGDATKWRLLYDANRDVLKSPDRLKAGMSLRIPRAEGASGQAAESEPGGVTFRK